MIDAKWIEEAVSIIQKGIADKLCSQNITVYRCGKIIRIDIKEEN